MVLLRSFNARSGVIWSSAGKPPMYVTTYAKKSFVQASCSRKLMGRSKIRFLVLMRRSRNQRGMETAFNFPKMVLPATPREGEHRAVFCTTACPENHRDSWLF